MFEILPDMPQAAKFVVAFVVVLALIGLTAWLVRRFASNRLGAATRGRQPRLAVIDAASVDGRRRLVLIRRDNVEHLMMIGGPNDVIVEPNIVRAAAVREAGRDMVREPARSNAPDVTPRAMPLAENGGSWPLQPAVEPPMTPATPRPLRGNVPEEPWVASEPPAREPVREPPRESLRARPADSLTGMATSEFSSKVASEFDFAPSRTTPAPAREPAAVVPPPPAEPAAVPQTDRNLAEMAQRLEAALRRPNTTDYQPPVTDPLATAPAPKAEMKAEPKVEPKFEARPTPPKPDTKAPAAKNPFDSLEQEMASLLGRQPGKT
jgi:hypothetical protein